MQLEDLTRKSQFLEVELERTSRKLKETAQIAQEEAEKNKAAQEVIRSLTAQVRGLIVGSNLALWLEFRIAATQFIVPLCRFD